MLNSHQLQSKMLSFLCLVSDSVSNHTSPAFVLEVKQLLVASKTGTWILKLVVVVAGFGVTLGVILLGLAVTRTGKLYLSSLLYKGALEESEQMIKLREIMPHEHKHEHKLKARMGKILPQGWNPAISICPATS